MKINSNKTRKILAVNLQSACAESNLGLDIIFALLLNYVPSKVLKEQIKLAKKTRENV